MHSNAEDRTRLLELLQDSLLLWQAAGTVEAAEAPALAIIQIDGGITVSLERSDDGSPFRWIVREPSGHGRRCASLVGALGALRSALGLRSGSSVRVG